MNQIPFDFEQARAKHLLFKSRLRSLLYGLPADVTPVISHTECQVGQWIYSEALPAYGHIPEMQDLERVHRDIHTVARTLVALYNDGKVEEARAGLEEVEKTAQQLTTLLSAVEAKLGAGEGTAGDKAVDAHISELTSLARANEKLEEVIRSHSGRLSAERQTLYDALMQLPATIAVLKGPDHVFELANPAFLAGFPNPDILGKPVREVLPSLEGQGFFELINHVYRTGEPFTGNEMKIIVSLEDGTRAEAYINLNYQALRNALGEIDGVISFSYNVSEAVLARKQAEESEKRFRFLSNAMPVQTWTADAAGTLQYVNEGWRSYFGKDADALQAEGWNRIVHPDDLAQVREKWAAAAGSHSIFEAEVRLRQHTGNYRWHLVRAVPYTSDDVLTWYGTSTDIHDMKSLQDQLRQSYEDLEVKVKFRNIELERALRELQKEVETLRAASTP
ncbi:PAS domain-containing protein [Flaviaesturariibacter amylovorans]|uniref:histidine kinase n=1 Tax=Flaviaesturariibacter amylovorans TaxID=1084520 RepID=A0ABP8HNZ5_9BACT